MGVQKKLRRKLRPPREGWALVRTPWLAAAVSVSLCFGAALAQPSAGGGERPAETPAGGSSPANASPQREAPAASRELLNSERIERTFGSYGIEVLESGDRIRISNLYSGDGAGRTTRTFAVVRYPRRVAPELAAEHETILAGGSIGAVFTASGWDVEKRHRYFGEVAARGELARRMETAEDMTLAAHVYVLHVQRAGRDLEYAAILEIHHPDYLGVDDLRRIYGDGRAEPGTSGADDLVREMLGVAAERVGSVEGGN